VLLLSSSVQSFKQNFNISYKKFSASDYAVLYNALPTEDWPSCYNKTLVDTAIGKSNVTITNATDLAVCSGNSKKNKYSTWFSGKLKLF
jgi:hypothetical protein